MNMTNTITTVATTTPINTEEKEDKSVLNMSKR